MALNVSMPVQNQIGFYDNVLKILNVSGNIYIAPEESDFIYIKPIDNIKIYLKPASSKYIQWLQTDSIFRKTVFIDSSSISDTKYLTFDDSNIMWNYESSPSVKLSTVRLQVFQFISCNLGRHWKALRCGAYPYTTTISVNVNTPIINNPTLVSYDSKNNINSINITTNNTSLSSGTVYHYASDWEIASDSNFDNIIFASYIDNNNLNSITVPNLIVGNTYYIRMRKYCFSANVSNYSNIYEFINNLTE